MQRFFSHERSASRFALAALALVASAALAPAQVQITTTPGTGRPYDLSINTGANRALVRGWIGGHDFFDLATGAWIPAPFGTATPWALTPFIRMVTTALTTKTRALSAGINFIYGGITSWTPFGGTIQLFDLTTPTPTLLVPALSSAPLVPHDMVLARNDTVAVVNCDGGVFWVDMTTGATQMTFHTGSPFINTVQLFCHASTVQSVIANDTRAVILRSFVGGGAIDLYDTTPFPAGLPVLISSTPTVDSAGGLPVEPYDLATSPDQNWVGVMTHGGDFYVVDLQSNGVSSGPGVGLAIDPNDFYDIKDAVQLSDGVAVATGLTYTSPAAPGGTIAVYDLANPLLPATFPIVGQPHDLAISPDQKVAAVNASAANGTPGALVVLSLNGAAGSAVSGNLPAAGFQRVWSLGGFVQWFPNPDDPKEEDVPEEGECWEEEVLESVRLTDSRLAVIGNAWTGLAFDASSPGTGYIEFYNTTVTPPALIIAHTQSDGSDGDVHDLDLSPNGAILGVFGDSYPTGFYKMSDGLLYGTSGVPATPVGTGNITYQHGVDAINLDDTRAVQAAGYGGNPGSQNVEIDDTCAAIPQVIVTGCPPATGWVAPGLMGTAPGSTTSIAANNLTLQCSNVGAGSTGRFFYGPRMMNTPVFVPTGGYSCVTSSIYRLPVITPTGTVFNYTLNYGALPGPGGSIFPGDTWYFQCWYRDLTSNPGFTTNISDALQVTFGP